MESFRVCHGATGGGEPAGVGVEPIFAVTGDLFPFPAFHPLGAVHGNEFDVGVVDAGTFHDESYASHVGKAVFQNFRDGFGGENEFGEHVIGHFKNIRSVVIFRDNNGEPFGVRIDRKKCHEMLVFPK